MAKDDRTVHWTHNGKQVRTIEDTPDGSIGFIYMVTNLTNGKWYIGRKTFRAKKKKKLTKKEKALPENSRKTYKMVDHEYKGWQNYTGSNAVLNEDIEKRKHKYKKEILRWCFSKAELTFYEGREIVCGDALLDDNCYNSWVSMKVFGNNLKQ